jgi:hypothetical protein
MSIQFGKVVKENTDVRIIFSYNHFYNPNSPRNDQFNGGVFYRKYKSLAKNFYFFDEGDALYFHRKETLGQLVAGNDGSKQISNGASLAFVPGVSYSLSKRMQMELLMPNIISLSYTHVKTQSTSAGTNSITTENGDSFSAGVNLSSNLLSNFGIGFKFFLGK